MQIIKLLDRIKIAHQLLLEEKTGTSQEFASKLNISRNQLYNVLDILKEYDAPIIYSKKINSFYYNRPFDLEVKFSLTIMIDEEKREIYK